MFHVQISHSHPGVCPDDKSGQLQGVLFDDELVPAMEGRTSGQARQRMRHTHRSSKARQIKGKLGKFMHLVMPLISCARHRSTHTRTHAQ
jgi:hypothetical protein